MGSNTEKKPWTNLQNSTIIEAKGLRATTFAIAILEKLPFLKVNKIISYLDGSNNIFANCVFKCIFIFKYKHFVDCRLYTERREED